MYIDRNKIENLHETLYFGTCATILKVKYDGQIYAQKVFDFSGNTFTDENQDININIYTPSLDDIRKFEIYTNIKAAENGVYLPEYLIGKYNSISYLTKIYDGINISNLLEKPIDKKMLFLRKTKELIVKINKDYGIIHSDIHFGNIKYNENNETIALIDFDSSKYENLECEKCYLSDFASNYLTYNNYDYKLDIYLFNLLTLGLLFDQSMKITCNDLRNKRFHNFFYKQSAIKTLEDMSNIRKNENFIIDMVDENVKSRILRIG